MARFENYEGRKGMWFWMMLSIASVVSEEPDLSAKKSDHLVKDFIDSDFFKSIFEDTKKNRKFYGKDKD